MKVEQLPLGLGLRDDMTFDNFCVGDNEHVLSNLRALLQGTGEKYVYLWGDLGVGRSHLLQACCHSLDSVDRHTLYLPLAEHEQFTPDIIEGMESMDLVCLDGINAVIGQRLWEEAIFHLYNRIHTTHCKLVIAADVIPTKLPCIMPDLRSRLSQGLVLQVRSLNDTQKLAVLQLRSKRRGLELSEEVGLYLLRHYPRKMAVLLEALQKLDEASLIEQRRLTIPFVRSVLGVK